MITWPVAILLLVASWVIGAATAPKPQQQKPTAFEDIDFPQAEEGTPQNVIFGDTWSGDWTVLAVGNYRTEPIKSSGQSKK